ncbi:MAG TPA: M1 family metallopeptidase [Gemmatimonadaceae bacterium]
MTHPTTRRRSSAAVAAMAAAMLLAGAASCAAQDARVAPPARTAVDVLDYDIALVLPDSGRRIAGDATLTVHRRVQLDTLVLDFMDLAVSDVAVNGRAVPVTRTAETLRIPLGPGHGDTLKVRVRYAGVPTDGLIIRDTLGRWSAFGDNWPNRARYWIPSVDHPSDKATVSWAVTVPPGRTVVANGGRLAAGRIRAQYDRANPTIRYREARPIPTYLMVIAAGALQRTELGDTACGLAEMTRCVAQEVWTLPTSTQPLPGPFARAGDIVSLFSRLVAPFPYEKLAHLQSATIFGGMENAGAIFYDSRLFETGRMSEGLIAHETAHQWFGDAVTETEWRDLWLSEGFATYFAALWTEHSRGVDSLRAQMAGIRAEILADTAAVTHRAVIDTTWRSPMELLNRNSYEKGGWVLHMLRGTVGDSAFFRGVRAYYLANRHRNADTKALQLAVEQASGKTLGWFFDQWLRRPGYPELTLGWRHDAAKREVVVQLEQGARFGAYRFTLPLAVVDAAGKRHKMLVEVSGAKDLLRLPVPFDGAPAALIVDPDVELLARVTVHALPPSS